MKSSAVLLVTAFASLVQADLPRKPSGKVDWDKLKFPTPRLPHSAFLPRIGGIPSEIWETDVAIKPFKKGTEDYSATCGKLNNPTVKERIVGGNEATPHRYPWACAVYIDTLTFCGCTVISNKWVLTAAHCTSGASNFELFLGSHDLGLKNEPGRLVLKSNKAVTHPGWSTVDLSNDIALIKLPQEISFTDSIMPICLPSHDQARETVDGKNLTIVGWGYTSDQTTIISDKLREVDVEVMSVAECQKNYYPFISEKQVCTISRQGKGMCSGDSGGSLSLNIGNDTMMQVSIPSFVVLNGCTLSEPQGSTRVGSYLSWVETETGIFIHGNGGQSVRPLAGVSIAVVVFTILRHMSH